jgi:hypothetical protein
MSDMIRSHQTANGYRCHQSGRVDSIVLIAINLTQMKQIHCGTVSIVDIDKLKKINIDNSKKSHVLAELPSREQEELKWDALLRGNTH